VKTISYLKFADRFLFYTHCVEYLLDLLTTINCIETFFYFLFYPYCRLRLYLLTECSHVWKNLTGKYKSILLECKSHKPKSFCCGVACSPCACASQLLANLSWRDFLQIVRPRENEKKSRK